MIKRKILFTSFLFFGLAMISCIGDCPPSAGEYFNITGISSLNHTNTAAQTIPDSFALKFEEYRGLDLKYSLSYYSLLEKSPLNRPGFGQLYALDCFPDGWRGSEEMYKSFNVITLNDFNEDYREGDTINEIMYLPFIDTLASTNSYIEYSRTKIYLKEAPTLSSKFKIKVIIELTNGEVYSKESPTVEFI